MNPWSIQTNQPDSVSINDPLFSVDFGLRMSGDGLDQGTNRRKRKYLLTFVFGLKEEFFGDWRKSCCGGEVVISKEVASFLVVFGVDLWLNMAFLRRSEEEGKGT